MFDEIFVEEKGNIKKIAAFDGGEMKEFVLFDKNKANEGNIYLGKIVKKIKTANGKEGFFVNIGDEKDAFINAEERFLEDLNACEGQNVIVQVSQEKRAEKGARLARFLQIAGLFLVYNPYGEDVEVSSKIEDDEKGSELGEFVAANAERGGWVVRTQAAEASKDKILEEMDFLQKEFDSILEKAKKSKAPELLLSKDNALDEMIEKSGDCLQKVVVNTRILEEKLKDKVNVVYNPKAFDEAGVDEKLQKALDKEIKLKSGGRVIIEETRAFVAIDVDSGEGASQGGFGRLNAEAAAEIAKQILLRNLSGKIIIDFAGVSDFKFLKNAMDVLAEGLVGDASKARVLGISRAGNVEIIRSRKRPSLSDLLTEECATCLGTGRVEK